MRQGHVVVVFCSDTFARERHLWNCRLACDMGAILLRIRPAIWFLVAIELMRANMTMPAYSCKMAGGAAAGAFNISETDAHVQ